MSTTPQLPAFSLSQMERDTIAYHFRKNNPEEAFRLIEHHALMHGIECVIKVLEDKKTQVFQRTLNNIENLSKNQ